VNDFVSIHIAVRNAMARAEPVVTGGASSDETEKNRWPGLVSVGLADIV
jgi:hypothetical protein